MALSRAFASAACDTTPDEARRRLGMSEGAAAGEAESNGARGGTRPLTILRELPHGCHLLQPGTTRVAKSVEVSHHDISDGQIAKAHQRPASARNRGPTA